MNEFLKNIFLPESKVPAEWDSEWKAQDRRVMNMYVRAAATILIIFHIGHVWLVDLKFGLTEIDWWVQYRAAGIVIGIALLVFSFSAKTSNWFLLRVPNFIILAFISWGQIETSNRFSDAP